MSENTPTPTPTPEPEVSLPNIDEYFDEEVVSLKNDAMDRIRAIALEKQNLLKLQGFITTLSTSKTRIEADMFTDVCEELEAGKKKYTNEASRRAAVEELKVQKGDKYKDPAGQLNYNQVCVRLDQASNDYQQAKITIEIHEQMLILDKLLLRIAGAE